LTEAKQVFEKEYLENLLKDTHGNISEVARRSGRYRADIYRLMERYGFEQGQYR
jgi:DNA-binding NtrC family response regulator